jgi:hypothetical protein
VSMSSSFSSVRAGLPIRRKPTSSGLTTSHGVFDDFHSNSVIRRERLHSNRHRRSGTPGLAIHGAPGFTTQQAGGRPKSPDERLVEPICTRLHAMRTDFRLTLYSDCLGVNRKTRFIVCNRVQMGHERRLGCRLELVSGVTGPSSSRPGMSLRGGQPSNMFWPSSVRT